MSARQIPGLDYDSETKNHIMEVAITLFAKKSFAAVTTRDIANAAGINVALLYYYYKSKETLFEDIISFFERGYNHYFDWLSEMNEKAETLEDVMDNMFNDEFVNMRNEIACLGMSVVIKEQHCNESARKCVFDLFYGRSIDSMKADFDRLIERGVIPPTDTKTIAMFFMFSVMVSNEIRLHKYTGTEPPLECAEIYAGLKKHITDALRHGC